LTKKVSESESHLRACCFIEALFDHTPATLRGNHFEADWEIRQVAVKFRSLMTIGQSMKGMKGSIGQKSQIREVHPDAGRCGRIEAHQGASRTHLGAYQCIETGLAGRMRADPGGFVTPRASCCPVTS